MNTLSYKTISANKENAGKKWLLVDANGETLGRLSSLIAIILRGKHKTNFTPHADCGDNVVVINAEKVKLSGKKWTDKKYISYTGYPGGQRTTTPSQLIKKKPEALVERAVKGMLPKNRLGRELFRNLYVYTGSKHEQSAQNPEMINLKSIK